jgi:hypothetical protein
MSLLDDLLLGFDEALEWPLDDDAETDEARGVDPGDARAG